MTIRKKVSSSFRRISTLFLFYCGVLVDCFTLLRSSLDQPPLKPTVIYKCHVDDKENGTSPHNIISDGSIVKAQTFHERYSSVLPEWLLTRCSEELGWTHPTRIQQYALDQIVLENSGKRNDYIIQAETGSGKTLCYLLPCLAAIDPTRSAVQALIVVPTRELGLQVARVAKRLAAASSKENKIMVMSVLQGSQNRRQRAWAWAEPPHLIIGTPMEVTNMVRWGGIRRYNSVQTVVVDEVDACLLNNAGSFRLMTSSVLHELLSKYLSPSYDDGSDHDETNRQIRKRPISRQRQTIFCSATIPQPRHFMKQCLQNQWMLHDPIHLRLQESGGEQLLPPTLQHNFLVCSGRGKLAVLKRIIQKLWKQEVPQKVLIFSEDHRPLEDMAQALALAVDGMVVQQDDNSDTTRSQEKETTAIISVLRYEDSLSRRAAAMDAFRADSYLTMQTAGNKYAPTAANRNAQLRVLLATDMAARGLDVPDITHVVHFDLPPDADTYVHRAGRTGRAGRDGTAVSLVTPDQEFVLQRIANKLSLDLVCLARQKDAEK